MVLTSIASKDKSVCLARFSIQYLIEAKSILGIPNQLLCNEKFQSPLHKFLNLTSVTFVESLNIAPG